MWKLPACIVLGLATIYALVDSFTAGSDTKIQPIIITMVLAIPTVWLVHSVLQERKKVTNAMQARPASLSLQRTVASAPRVSNSPAPLNKMQAHKMRTKEDINLQTGIGCIGVFAVFVLVIFLAFRIYSGMIPFPEAFIFLFLLGGCILFAIIWPIRGAWMKDNIRRQLSKLSYVTLSSSGGKRIDYIPLPEQEALVFESDPTPSLSNIEVPDAVHNYVNRLISPVIAKYAFEGWELDEDKLYPLEPDLVMINKLIPFKKAKYRYEGVKAYLRRM